MYAYAGNNPVNFVDPWGYEILGAPLFPSSPVAPIVPSPILTPPTPQIIPPAQDIGILTIQSNSHAGKENINQGQFGSKKERGSSSPTGKPNSKETFPKPDGGKTVREYGKDGKAIRDVDYGHNHGAGDPHIHDWDWSGPRPIRGIGRPL